MIFLNKAMSFLIKKYSKCLNSKINSINSTSKIIFAIIMKIEIRLISSMLELKEKNILATKKKEICCKS